MKKCWGCKKMFKSLIPHQNGLYCVLCSEKITYKKVKKTVRLAVVQTKLTDTKKSRMKAADNLYVEGFSLADAIGNFGTLAFQLGYTHFWWNPLAENGIPGWYDNPKTRGTITAKIN